MENAYTEEMVVDAQEEMKVDIMEMHKDVTPDKLTEADLNFLYSVAYNRSHSGNREEVEEVYNDYLHVASNLSAFQ